MTDLSQSKRTKFVCTIGPASSSPEVLSRLINQGMSIARLNMCHCSYEFVRTVISRIRSIACDRLVGILLDTNGPKIRTGRFRDDAQFYLASSAAASSGNNNVGTVADSEGNEPPASSAGHLNVNNEGAANLSEKSFDLNHPANLSAAASDAAGADTANNNNNSSNRVFFARHVYLEAGQTFSFINEPSDYLGDVWGVSTTNSRRIVEPGEKIYVDDGMLSFTVVAIEEAGEGSIIAAGTSVHNPNLKSFKSAVHCVADNSGWLGEAKGVNLPGHNNSVADSSSLNRKDLEDIRFAISSGVEFVTVSCIRDADDVMEVKKLLGNSRIKLLSKIENKAGSENFENIIRMSDGIIIDRGYLGVELDVQHVTLRQKELINRCNLLGKPVLVANHVLETLCSHPRPTRSEASDITSAIMDGVDGLVLSAETAVGKYPVEALVWASRIAGQVEAQMDYHHFCQNITRYVEKPIGISESIASSVIKCAREVEACCIIVITEAGGTARLISKYRTNLPVIAATADPLTARQLTSSFGLIPYWHDEQNNPGQWVMTPSAGGTPTATSYITRQQQLSNSTGSSNNTLIKKNNVTMESLKISELMSTSNTTTNATNGGELTNQHYSGILKAAMKFAVSKKIGRLGAPVVIASGQVHGFIDGTTTVMQVIPLTL